MRVLRIPHMFTEKMIQILDKFAIVEFKSMFSVFLSIPLFLQSLRNPTLVMCLILVTLVGLVEASHIV